MNFSKDPDAVLDYMVDWAAWLYAGDQITNAAVVVNPPGGAVIESQTHTDTTTTVWISGGAVGTKYTFTTHVTTADGREDDRSFTLTIKER